MQFANNDNENKLNDIINQNLPQLYYRKINTKSGGNFMQSVFIPVELRRKMLLKSIYIDHIFNKYENADSFNYQWELYIEFKNVSDTKKHTPDGVRPLDLHINGASCGNVMPINLSGVYRDILEIKFIGSNIPQPLNVLLNTILIPEDEYQPSR